MTSHLVVCWIFQEILKELSASEISIQVIRRHVIDDCNLHGHRNKMVSFTCPLQTCLALHSPVVTIWTSSLTFIILRSVHTVCLCFVWIWEQTANMSLYKFNWLVFRHVRKISKSENYLSHVCPSVHMHGKTGWIYIKFNIHRYFENLSRKFHQDLTKMTGNLREHHYTLMITSRSVPLITRNVSEKKLERKKNVMLNNFFPRKSSRLWDKVEKFSTAGGATDDNTVHAHCMLNT